MIGKFHVQRLFLAISSKKALTLLKSIIRSHGFEITETIDLDAFACRQTGSKLNRKITLVQMHKPAMTLGSALLNDILPLILPLRVIVREIGDEKSVMYFPCWEVVRDAEATQAEHCMNVLYAQALTEIVVALKESFGGTPAPDDAKNQVTQPMEATHVFSDSGSDNFFDPSLGAAFRPRANAPTTQPIGAGEGGSNSHSARCNKGLSNAVARLWKGSAFSG